MHLIKLLPILLFVCLACFVTFARTAQAPSPSGAPTIVIRIKSDGIQQLQNQLEPVEEEPTTSSTLAPWTSESKPVRVWIGAGFGIGAFALALLVGLIVTIIVYVRKFMAGEDDSSDDSS